LPKLFEAHGTFSLKLCGQIIQVEGTGPWNLESLNLAKQKSATLLDAFVESPWAVMMILRGECIFVHAASTKLSEYVQQEKQQGRRATAFLVNNCDEPNFAKLHLSDIYDKAGETYEFFDDIDLAKLWLDEKLQQDANNP
jgi:hypothetical protein